MDLGGCFIPLVRPCNVLDIVSIFGQLLTNFLIQFIIIIIFIVRASCVCVCPRRLKWVSKCCPLMSFPVVYLVLI